LNTAHRLIDGLANAPAGLDDYTDYLEQLVSGVEEVEDPKKVFPHAFRFFEDHPDVELGTPGALVHFIEKFFPDYIDDLCTSLARRSTAHTVWMLNRILNADIPSTMRQRLLDILGNVAADPSTDETVREEALGFLKHQKG
jgi:hypothetical protein